MLKPNGRMAIILPQGKFNNSSLAYIREWLLHRARLLAVVGLHLNTFKPHTGTKTSVLFLQKYTEEEISLIKAIEDSIKEKAPDYAMVIQDLLGKVPLGEDVLEDELPEELAELLQEQFAVQVEEGSEDGDRRDEEEESHAEVEASDPDLLAEEIEHKSVSLAEIKVQLARLGEEKRRCRISRKDTALEIAAKQERQEWLRAEERRLKSGLRVAEKDIIELQTTLAMLTIKGKLGLLLADQKALAEIRQKWVDAEIAKELDYPVFMATSERGGKDSSGEYLALVRMDGDGNIIEIAEDNYGNLLVDQDCIAYRKEDPPGIAEAFIEWAKRQKLTFWRGD
jgi:type I restriction enzyme M protein